LAEHLDPPPAAAERDGNAATAAGRTSRRRLRLWLLPPAAVLALMLAVPPVVDALVTERTAKAVANGIDELAPKPVALLLGTARRTPAGRPNPFYHARIEAAAALFHSGKVQGILVSGDNATRWYNEPIAMQKDLIAAGVPADFITLDYAGFRTLDSVIRAKEVFGQQHIIVVSQRFHAERAIFLARHYGIDASGLAARDPDHMGMVTVRAREVFARVAAVLDLVTGRAPKFLGKPETVRLRKPVADDAA
jgi:SanA protein